MVRHLRAPRDLIFVSILCAGVVTGCGRTLTQPSQLPLGQSFELRAGRSATLQGGLTITFDRVISDSRCPMDALCVWAGDAVVAVSLSQAPEPVAQRELHVDPRQSTASYRDYSIKLVALAPYPRSDRQIEADQYVATLTVDAR